MANPYNQNIIKNIMKAKDLIKKAKEEGITLTLDLTLDNIKPSSYQDIINLKNKDNYVANAVHELEKKYLKLKSELSINDLSKYENNILKEKDLNLLIMKIGNEDNDTLKNIADTLVNKYANMFILFANVNQENINFIARSNSLIDAGKIIKDITKLTGGNGGGSNKFARGAGKDINKLDESLETVKNGILNG